MNRAAETTPLRAAIAEEHEGCRVLGAIEGRWTDGGEARIAEILAGARDLSSLSDELAGHSTGWVERYHFARERGNIIRPLELEGAAILEVGAGCGAVTRALGERAALVDALEPNPARARCARLRTRDLRSVEVFVGDLEQVPRERVYDAVVVIGVLEYVGGAPGDAERVAFLREAAARLRRGGSLVLAIENRLGVKYLAGSPEDHADRPFEGLEGYPHGGPFRTFARSELEALFRAADLEAEIYHAFPDYKLPRLLFSDALLSGPGRPLAWRVPRFPSYDTPSPRPRLAAELQLWRGLVHAGLGGEFANSFLALARPAGGPSLWRADLQAAFYTGYRRARFVTETRVVEADGGLELRRVHAERGETPRVEGDLKHHASVLPFVHGDSLLEEMERADGPELATLLGRWVTHAQQTARSAAEGTNFDLTPDNVIVTADLGLITVDDEWRQRDESAEHAVARSLLHLARELADRRPPEGWPPDCGTLGELATHLARLAGVPHLLDDIDEVVRREAVLQAQVVGVAPGDDGWDERVEEERERLRDLLDQPLTLSALGLREWEVRSELDERGQDLVAKVEEFHELLIERHERLEAANAAIDRLEADLAGRDAAIALGERELNERHRRAEELARELEQLRSAHAEVVTSRSWRLTSSVRRLAARVRRTS